MFRGGRSAYGEGKALKRAPGGVPGGLGEEALEGHGEECSPVEEALGF